MTVQEAINILQKEQEKSGYFFTEFDIAVDTLIDEYNDCKSKLLRIKNIIEVE